MGEAISSRGVSRSGPRTPSSFGVVSHDSPSWRRFLCRTIALGCTGRSLLRRFDESQQLVARTLASTNSGVVWYKFHIYQGHRVNTPYIQIGTKRKNPPRLKLEKHPNAIKRALHYKELLDSGQVDSQGELSRLCRHAPHHDVGLPASPRVG